MRLLSWTILGLSTSIIAVASCHKTATFYTSEKDRLVSAAQNYYRQAVHSQARFGENIRLKHLRSVKWDQAEVRGTKDNMTLVVPIDFDRNLIVSTNISGAKCYHLNDISQLIYRRTRDTPIIEIMTAFPDSNYSLSERNKFSGIVLIEDLSGHPTVQYRVDLDGSIYKRELSTKQSRTLTLSEDRIKPTVWITTCYQIEGYNYAADTPDEIYSWVEDAGCSSMYVPVFSIVDVGGGYFGVGSGDGGLPSPRATPSIVAVNHGPNQIGNISDYFKCFTNVGGSDHKYTVTICVDQPVLGSRQAWAFQENPNATSAGGNPFNVGHVFLIFSETYGFTNIKRSIGFYPQEVVRPGATTSQGELDNNDQSSYDISLTINLDNGQFFNMLNFVSQGNAPGFLYDLNSNNCTSFVINALQSAGINIPWHTGSWPGGSGYNPGDLGEDIRSMSLSNNMYKSAIPLAHPNQGNCN